MPIYFELEYLALVLVNVARRSENILDCPRYGAAQRGSLPDDIRNLQLVPGIHPNMLIDLDSAHKVNIIMISIPA